MEQETLNDAKEKFLSEKEIEKILKNIDFLEPFWEKPDSLLLFRSTPSLEDPLYEIQLVLDLGSRLETYGWIWVDALSGSTIKVFPDP